MFNRLLVCFPDWLVKSTDRLQASFVCCIAMFMVLDSPLSAQPILIEPEVLVLKGAPGDTVTGLITIKNNKAANPNDPTYNRLSMTITGDDAFYDWESWQSYFQTKRDEAEQAGELFEYNQRLSKWDPADILSNVAGAPSSLSLDPGESITMLVMMGPFPILEEAGPQQFQYTPNFYPEDYSVYGSNYIRLEITHPEPIDITDPGLAQVLDIELNKFFSAPKNSALPASFSTGDPIRPYHISYLETVSVAGFDGPLVTQIDALKHAENLTSLNLFNQDITSLEALRNLKGLTALYLDGNQISDIGPLANLDQLEQLYIRNNWIDFSPGSPASNIIDQLRANGTNVVHLDQRPGMRTINSWFSEVNLPGGTSSAEAKTGPLQLPNVLSFAMGVDPLAPSAEELPSAGRSSSSASEADFTYRYKRDLKAIGIRTAIEATSDLKTWTEVIPDSIRVISDDGNGVQLVEASFSDPTVQQLFFRLKVLTNN